MMTPQKNQNDKNKEIKSHIHVKKYSIKEKGVNSLQAEWKAKIVIEIDN